MEGLIKCAIVPTETLYHPVLPSKCNNKVIFCLCRICFLASSREAYGHSEAVMDKVRLTVEKGYRINETYEVYE